MKVSISWLKELTNLKVPIEEVIRLLPLRTIGTKEITNDFIELDMKGYNRADLLSMRGVAIEIAAITNSEVTFIESPDYMWNNLNLPQTETVVEDANLAPIYCLARIEGLRVEKSSADWIKKLNNGGIRSVNNIADITNVMMLEYGQPMHAFDQEKVKGNVRVRVAKKDEKITTLDGKVRNLNESNLLITDDNGPIGIAGIMGGKDSEISDNTTSILLEAAIFDPINIRKTASRLNLQSEASKRFQHGLTKTNLLQALNSAIKMYESLGGKLTAITLTGNLEDKIRTIKLSQDKINSLIGIDIPSTQVESSLTKLGFKLTPKHPEGEEMRLHLLGRLAHVRGGIHWAVTVPYWRLDINIEEDLIEEVARMYGYEKIPPKELIGGTPQKVDESFFKFISKLKSTLANLGLTEVQTYSFYSTALISDFGFRISDLLKLLNPMSAETEYLRDKLWPNLLEATARNIRNGIKDVAIFEIGKVFSPQEGDTPKESYHLSIALSNGTDNPLAELNQIVQTALKHLRGEEMRLHPGGEQGEKEYFHPTRYIGNMAEVHPRFVNKFRIEQRVAVLEVELTTTQ